MTHKKSNKISFSLRDQLSKAQSIFGGKPMVNTSSTINFCRSCDYYRKFFLSPDVEFGFRIEKDDKLAHGLIECYFTRSVYLNGNASFVSKTKELSYSEFKTIMNAIAKSSSVIVAIHQLNKLPVFEDDLVLFLMPELEFISRLK